MICYKFRPVFVIVIFSVQVDAMRYNNWYDRYNYYYITFIEEKNLFSCGCKGEEITLNVFNLKEYYEIVDESRPLSGFFPTHADFFYRKAFIIMKLSNPPNFRAIRALIASQSTFEI